MAGRSKHSKFQVRFDGEGGGTEKTSKERLETIVSKDVQRKRWQQRFLERMRRELMPELTVNDVRRLRLPYHEALMLELKEKGYVNSARLFDEIVGYQEMYRKKSEEDEDLHRNAVLTDSRSDMNYLYDRLIAAEDFSRQDRPDGELDVLLGLIAGYAFGPSEWWWLAERLFPPCLSLADGYRDDGGMRRAKCRYFLGRHLLVNRGSVREATDVLRRARENCAGRFSWSLPVAERLEGERWLHACVGRLLYRAHMTTVRAKYEVEPAAAAALAVEARRLSRAGCFPGGEALLYLARCYVELGRTAEAVEEFDRAARVLLLDGQPEDACKALVGMATCCLDLARFGEAERTLRRTLELAAANDLPKYVGLANLYMGESRLNAGEFNAATEHLVKAVNTFSEIKDVQHCHFVDTLACVSRGLEIYEAYVGLVMDCDEPDSLERLLAWKDSRLQFWSVGETESGSSEERLENEGSIYSGSAWIEDGE